MASPPTIPDRHGKVWVLGENLYLVLPGDATLHHWWPINATAATQLVELVRLSHPTPTEPTHVPVQAPVKPSRPAPTKPDPFGLDLLDIE